MNFTGVAFIFELHCLPLIALPQCVELDLVPLYAIYYFFSSLCYAWSILTCTLCL